MNLNKKENTMAGYEMGEMPEAPESDELAMEGEDFESPEEESGSPLEELKSRLPELGEDELRELEAAIASELGKAEDGEEPLEEEDELEAPEESGEDLSSLFA